MVGAFADGLRGTLLQRGRKERTRDPAARAAVNDSRTDHDGADSFLRHFERELLVRRAPRDELGRIRRVCLVDESARGVAQHPDAARVDDGRAHSAVE